MLPSYLRLETYYPENPPGFLDLIAWPSIFAVALYTTRLACQKFLLEPIAFNAGILKASRPLKSRKKSNTDHQRETNGNVINRKKQEKAQISEDAGKQCSLGQSEELLYTKRFYKFSECGWQVIFYTCAVTFSIFYLWDKPWLWDTRDCWRDILRTRSPPGLFLLYQIQMGYYVMMLYCMVFQTDAKRKDKLEVYVHHITTLALIWGSMLTNMMKVGSLVIVFHDIADPGLMLAKMFWYAKRKETAEKVLCGAVVMWILSRLVLFPFRVIRSIFFDLSEMVDLTEFQVPYLVFKVLLCLLQVLHILWTISILRIALQKLRHGQIQKDVRSDTESDDSDSAETDNHLDDLATKNKDN